MFLPLIKADQEKRLIYARAAAEEPDKAREILDYLSAKPAFETWSKQYTDATMGKSAGNLRVMHNPRHVAGKIEKIIYNDGLKAIDVVAKVIDPIDWQKVEEGAYTGLSIGGGYARKWSDGATGCTRYTPRIQEISLVDAPCIPSARIMEMQKRDGSTEEVLLKGVPRTFSQMLPPKTFADLHKQMPGGPDLVLDQPRVIRRRGHQPGGKGPMQPMRAAVATKQEPKMDLAKRRLGHANKRELIDHLRKARLVDGVFNPTRNMRSSQQQPGRTAVVGDRPAGVAYAVTRYQPQLDELAFRLRAAANRERDQQGIGREQLAEIAYDEDPDVPLDHERDLPRRRKRNAKKLELIERLRKQGMLLQPDNSIGQWQAQHSDQWGPPPVGGPGLFGQKKPIVIQNVGLGGGAAQNYGPGGFGLAEPMGDMAKNRQAWAQQTAPGAPKPTLPQQGHINWAGEAASAIPGYSTVRNISRYMQGKSIGDPGGYSEAVAQQGKYNKAVKRLAAWQANNPGKTEPDGNLGKQRYPKSPEAKSKIQQVMHEWKHGQLRSWRSNKPKKKMPVVRNQKQAVAIALSQARRIGKAEDSDFVARLAGEHMEKALYGSDQEKIAFRLPRRVALKSADEEFLDLAKRCGVDEPLEKAFLQAGMVAAPLVVGAHVGTRVGSRVGAGLGGRLGALRAARKFPAKGSPINQAMNVAYRQRMIARHAAAGEFVGRHAGGIAGGAAGATGGLHALEAYERGKAAGTRKRHAEEHRETMKAEPIGPLLKALTGPPIEHDGHHHHQALTGPSVGTNGGHTHLPAHVERSEHGEEEEHRHTQHEDPGNRLLAARDRWHREDHVDLDAYHAQLLHHANRALLGRANKVASTHKQIAETWHHVATAQEAYDKMRPHVPEGHHVMMEVPHVGGLVYNPEGVGPDHFDNRGKPHHVIYMMHPHEVDDWIKKHGQHAEKRAPDFPGRILHFDDLEKQLTRVGEALVTGARKLGSHMISAAPKIAAGTAGGALVGSGLGAGVGAIRSRGQDPKTGRFRTRGQQILASAKRGAAIGANLGGLGAAI